MAPQIMKIQVYFGGHSGAYISQTRFGLLHGRHVRMSCQQRQISAVGKSSMTQPAKSVVWKLKLADMHCGTAQMLVKSGSLLSFQSNTMGYSLTAFIDLIWHLMLAQHVGDELLGIIITLAWSIWHNKNTARTGGARQTCTSIIQKAMLLLEEYQIANHKIKLPVAPHNVTWSPPSNSWYKINANDAVFNSVVNSALKAYSAKRRAQSPLGFFPLKRSAPTKARFFELFY